MRSVIVIIINKRIYDKDWKKSRISHACAKAADHVKLLPILGAEPQCKNSVKKSPGSTDPPDQDDLKKFPGEFWIVIMFLVGSSWFGFVNAVMAIIQNHCGYKICHIQQGYMRMQCIDSK